MHLPYPSVRYLLLHLLGKIGTPPTGGVKKITVPDKWWNIPREHMKCYAITPAPNSRNMDDAQRGGEGTVHTLYPAPRLTELAPHEYWELI